MAYTEISPNVDNYIVGKGVVKWKPEGDTVYRDVGNVPSFEITITVTKLDHFSSRQGVKFKDKSVVLEKSATVKFVLEEFTGENLAMAFLGDLGAGPPITVDIFTLSEIKGALRLIGTNDIGVKAQYDLPFVTLTPSAAVQLISDTWGGMELTGEVTGDTLTGSFGQINLPITTEIPVVPAP